MSVNLTRLLAERSGLTKKRNGKLSLTKKGENLSADNCKLFELIFNTMASNLIGPTMTFIAISKLVSLDLVLL